MRHAIPPGRWISTDTLTQTELLFISGVPQKARPMAMFLWITLEFCENRIDRWTNVRWFLHISKHHLNKTLHYQVPGEEQSAGVETEGQETNTGNAHFHQGFQCQVRVDESMRLWPREGWDSNGRLWISRTLLLTCKATWHSWRCSRGKAKPWGYEVVYPPKP